MLSQTKNFIMIKVFGPSILFPEYSVAWLWGLVALSRLDPVREILSPFILSNMINVKYEDGTASKQPADNKVLPWNPLQMLCCKETLSSVPFAFDDSFKNYENGESQVCSPWQFHNSPCRKKFAGKSY